MYLSFYNLHKQPFQISTDPAFLWLGEKHREALATLKYGVLDNKGFLLITGGVGTGKTTLINTLVDNLGDDVIVARVPDPGMEKMDLMNFIGHSFNMSKEFARKDLFLVHFNHFLNSAHARNKKVLLIIDEAQRMSSELLEEVRQLSNLERQEAKLLNIFLVGQNELNELLLHPENSALSQRITMHYTLEKLNLEETSELINHRLQVAGATREIFTPGAIQQIYRYTDGTPRRINILCDYCLVCGYAQGERTIDDALVVESAGKQKLPVRLKAGAEHAAVDIGDLLPDDDIFADDEDEGNAAQESWEQAQGEYEVIEVQAPKKIWSAPLATVIVCGGLALSFMLLSGKVEDSTQAIKGVSRGGVTSTIVNTTEAPAIQAQAIQATLTSTVNESGITSADEGQEPPGVVVTDSAQLPQESEAVVDAGIERVADLEPPQRQESEPVQEPISFHQDAQLLTDEVAVMAVTAIEEPSAEPDRVRPAGQEFPVAKPPVAGDFVHGTETTVASTQDEVTLGEPPPVSQDIVEQELQQPEVETIAGRVTDGVQPYTREVGDESTIRFDPAGVEMVKVLPAGTEAKETATDEVVVNSESEEAENMVKQPPAPFSVSVIEEVVETQAEPEMSVEIVNETAVEVVTKDDFSHPPASAGRTDATTASVKKPTSESIDSSRVIEWLLKNREQTE